MHLPSRLRVNLLAVGDVGSTLLTALKLLGGDCIESIGICDLNQKTVARWVTEMEQVSWPWDYDALPAVEPVAAGDLFRCDVFLFAATRGVPPVGGGVRDVRMAQFGANRPAGGGLRPAGPAGGIPGTLYCTLRPGGSPVQGGVSGLQPGARRPVGRAGLRAEQIQGFGLGVMNARAPILQTGSPVPQLPAGWPQLWSSRSGAGDRQLPLPL